MPYRLPGAVRLMLACAISAPAAALPTQSWNGYHWARTGPLAIQIGSNVGSAWSSYVATAITQWTAAKNIDFVPIAGSTTAATCDPVFGTVQVCDASYGKTGWLGYATVYTSGTVIVEATVKLNDYYFTGGYDTAAWRAMTACQEIGHTLGLAHNDTVRTDVNKGTCMDYTNDPTGTKGGANGTLANIAPAASDFAALGGIYATLDTTQLASTKPGYRTGDGYYIGRDADSAPQALPEPASWMLFVAGFGGVGAVLRRRKRRTAA